MSVEPSESLESLKIFCALSGELLGELKLPTSYFDLRGLVANFFDAPRCRLEITGETLDSVKIIKRTTCAFCGERPHGSCRYCDYRPSRWCVKCGRMDSRGQSGSDRGCVCEVPVHVAAE
jgi:hypothetical protein